MNNRWTIYGARGVIGRRILERLRSEGADVLAPVRGENLFGHESLGHIIFAAGLTADFRVHPFATVEAHVNLLAEVLQHANFESLLYLSSTRVYARASLGREDLELPVLTQDSSDLYNLSKLLGESLCLQDPRSSVRVVRLSNVVGGEDQDSENFIPSLWRAARSGRIVLRTALESAKDYIHIDDVTNLLPDISICGSERIYNVASGIMTTHGEWVSLFVERTGCAVEVADNAPVVRFVPIDIRRIQSEFNFHPTPPQAAIIGSYFNN